MTNSPLTTDEIVRAGLCIGCGLCQGLVGSHRLKLVMTPEGRERPVQIGELTEGENVLINAVCPGLRIDGADPDDAPPNTEIDLIWGPASEIVVGHAGNEQVRFRASAGGILTALGQHLIESGRVKFVLHVAASKDRPMRTERKLSFTATDVLEAAGSRYGPAAILVDFDEILAREEPFAVIAKPCDITAIRNLARSDPRVNRLLRYRLAIVCGGASELTKSEEVLGTFNVSEDDLSLFRYRGYGNPGATRLETGDGRVHEISYRQLWEDDAKWMIQPRCKICPDAIGELADIVVLDVWPGGTPNGEDAGFNGIVVRTESGRELLAAAVSTGAVVIDRHIDFRDLDIFQPHQVRKKRAVWARLTGMDAAGMPVPDVRSLRIDACAGLNTLAENLAEARGARRRAKSGRLGEPGPRPREVDCS